MKYLKDYVWMQRGVEPPKKVGASMEELTQHMRQGYVQVDPPAHAPRDEAKE